MQSVIFVICFALPYQNDSTLPDGKQYAESKNVSEVTPQGSKHYRTDYVYNQKTDAFYKLHIDTRSPGPAETVCNAEGATLMNPSSDYDIIQLHIMLKQFPDQGEYVWVADDGQAHESAENPIIDLNPMNDNFTPDKLSRSSNCLVVTRDGVVESMPCYRQLPFICKVAAKDAPFDRHCNVFGNDYKYFASVGSCYKIPKIAYTWSEAYSECQAESAHLVVINSEAEREVVKNLTRTEPTPHGARCSWFFFAGFRAAKPAGNSTNTPIVFKTVFNQTLEEAGFSKWSENEPNNAEGREYCGTIFNADGLFNDIDCTHTFGFICEKEVQKL